MLRVIRYKDGAAGAAETTMTWAWIAGRLKMGTAGYVAACLRQR